MFCTKCGEQIKDNSNFCPFCGNKVGNTDKFQKPEKESTILSHDNAKDESNKNRSFGSYATESIYEQQLKLKADKEEKVDNIEGFIAIILAIISMVKSGITLQFDILTACTCIVVGAIVEIVLIPLAKIYKKNAGIYKAKDKLDKYRSMKGTCDEQVLIQTIEIGSVMEERQGKGLLYFLVCVLIIIIIFSFL